MGRISATVWLFLISSTTVFAQCDLAVRSHGSNGWDVMLAQSLLSEHLNQKLELDGKWGPLTTAAWTRFQKDAGRPVNNRLDAAGWKVLFGNETRYLLKFIQELPKPNKSERQPIVRLYESKVILTQLDADGSRTVFECRGSIMPDDMQVKGRIQDGWYEVSLGFHRRSVNRTVLIPQAIDLRVKSIGTLRPSLVVNRDRKVPVTSDNSEKKSSTYIHVHNGLPNGENRSSEGCLTIQPRVWTAFMCHFLKSYPDLRDWYNRSHSDGKTVGVLIVETRESIQSH